ncbi:MAG: SRPBCC domain-containing protein [Ignavibacteria bacterium]
MSLEDNFDFGKFIQRIYISSDINHVYKMCTTSGNLEQWYLKSSVIHTQEGKLRERDEKIMKNDEYEWTWIDGAKLHGIILESDGKENLKFSFGVNVSVSISLKPKGNRTLVELVQEQDFENAEMKFNNYMACFPGWQFYLINLKSVCEKKTDLRELNPDVDFLVNI